MQKVIIYTNPLLGGWSPLDLDTGLGGSEEAVIHLAAALHAEGFEVVVYHTQTEEKDLSFNGVDYKERTLFESSEDDILICFKDKYLWSTNPKAKKKIHWTTEVEKPWSILSVDHVVHISEYHRRRNLWIPSNKAEVSYLGVDKSSLQRNQCEKFPGLMLYCSSPDRGLETLLLDWPKIYNANPGLELWITYGFDIIDQISKYSPKTKQFKEHMLSLMNHVGIKFLGKLSKDRMEEAYWKATYWIHPVNKADSELFCLNAIKSRYCKAVPVVNKIGALKETVGNHIPYSDIIKGAALPWWSSSDDFDFGEQKVLPRSWKTVVQEDWIPLFEGCS